jgi:hypothetical protein
MSHLDCPEDDPNFLSLSLSLLLNIMSCNLFCICGTIFNVYDPLIETGLIIIPCQPCVLPLCWVAILSSYIWVMVV